MIRKIWFCAIGIVMVALAWGAPPPQAATKKNAPKQAPKPATRQGTKTSGSRTAASRQSKKPAAPRTTWRNRQTVPSPERYREIQEALVAKGYMSQEEAAGNWGDSSTAALKKFQADQNLETTGKINSLSLIALGLGPKRDTPPTPPKPPAQTPDAGSARQ
jgi:hypothetical protein